MSNARTYKTDKGTELPLLLLKGKEYLEVKYRIVWFREDHPNWSIETQLVSVTDVSAYAKATIKDEAGRIIATSHKFENVQGFSDFIEKAETGSIGRALALIGYGTQFCADELDEGKRIVDSPASRPSRPASANHREASNSRAEEIVAKQSGEMRPASDPGEFVITFGRKFKGMKIKEISKAELESFLKWIKSTAVRDGTDLSYQCKMLEKNFNAFYGIETDDEIKAALDRLGKEDFDKQEIPF